MFVSLSHDKVAIEHNKNPFNVAPSRLENMFLVLFLLNTSENLLLLFSIYLVFF